MFNNNQAVNLVNFLNSTLIPDLKEMKKTDLIKTFKTAIRFIGGSKKSGGFNQKEFLNHLKNISQEYRESGWESTADDLDACYHMIYWRQD